MMKNIMARIRDKLDKSAAKGTVKNFLKQTLAWEMQNSEKEHPKYREAYEQMIREYIVKDEEGCK